MPLKDSSPRRWGNERRQLLYNPEDRWYASRWWRKDFPSARGEEMGGRIEEHLEAYTMEPADEAISLEIAQAQNKYRINEIQRREMGKLFRKIAKAIYPRYVWPFIHRRDFPAPKFLGTDETDALFRNRYRENVPDLRIPDACTQTGGIIAEMILYRLRVGQTTQETLHALTQLTKLYPQHFTSNCRITLVIPQDARRASQRDDFEREKQALEYIEDTNKQEGKNMFQIHALPVTYAELSGKVYIQYKAEIWQRRSELDKNRDG